MSLDYNLSKVAEDIKWVDNPDKPGEKMMSKETHSIIWLMLAVECGHEITEANAEEMFIRMEIWQKAIAPIWHNGDGTPVYVTFEDVKNHIGLSTNVSPKRSRTYFMKKMEQSITDDLRYNERKLANA